jgi:hypothetical protein
MKSLAMLLGAMLCSASAFSGTVVCSGTVVRVAQHANNNLMVQLSSMNAPVFICNIETNWTVSATTFSTGPNMCKALLAMFLEAKATDTTINNLYFDGDAVPTTCTGWANCTSAFVRYFDM